MKQPPRYVERPSLERSARRQETYGLQLRDLDDHVGRQLGTAGGLPDGLSAVSFIETIGLLLVRTEEGKEPVDADIVVDQLHPLGAFAGHLELLREVSLDQEKWHDFTPRQ